MRRLFFLICAVLYLGCSGVKGEAPVPAAATLEPAATKQIGAPPPTVNEVANRAGRPLVSDRGELFLGSGVCSGCHTRLVDAAGNDVSIDAHWRSTMHANAARDPYWLASVRAETLHTPALQIAIEDKCVICHSPMAHTDLAQKGEPAQIFADGLYHPDNPLNGLAIDGVSCSLCHQIRADNLGKPEADSGGFQIDFEARRGERVLYGPYEVDRAQAAMMQTATGFTLQQGGHLQTSEFCAVCHTLYTQSVGKDGKPTGKFPEQMVYLEWQHSSFNNQQSCQSCHMPVAEGAVKTAVVSQIARAPFAQHTFTGGNAYMLGLLQSFGEELQVTASSDHFANALSRTDVLLSEKTAQLELNELSAQDDQIAFTVTIKNLAGHKLPSGFPSRRMWLHLTIEDGAGKVLFETGGVQSDGKIQGNENDADPSLFEPHYRTIDQPDQVQIYESIMMTGEREVTTTLLRAMAYAKDNRLIPEGFDKNYASSEIAVIGEAAGDEDFTGGEDQLMFSVTVADAPEPYTISAELLFQTIGFRWARNLRTVEAEEIDRFMDFYQQIQNTPVILAKTKTQFVR